MKSESIITLIFSIATILLFILLCIFLFHQNKIENEWYNKECLKYNLKSTGHGSCYIINSDKELKRYIIGEINGRGYVEEYK